MLDLSQSRIYESIEVPLYNFANSFEDGTGLIGKEINGIMSATTNSTATNNDLFLGIALSTLSSPVNGVNVLAITVPSSAPYTVILPAAPNAGQISIVDAVAGTAYVSEGSVGAVTAVSEFNLTGSTLTFYSGNAGASLVVTYQYALTAIQAQNLVGYGLIGGLSPSNITGTIGVIKRGLVFTSMFDASINWNATTGLLVGNNGIFTASTGTGAAVNGYVAQAPSVGSPTLGIFLRG
jgi:hypothetical protein